jgi:hypothetical protein
MSSSGMFRRVALVRTDFTEECSTSVIRSTRIGELRTTLAVNVVPMKNAVFWDVTPCGSCKNRSFEGT